MIIPSFKLLSYNIHKGFSAYNRRFVLKLIRDSIQPIGANIVFLQEVIGEQKEHAERWDSWPAQSQFEYLADQLWSHFAYGKNAVYSAGHHGNAILSEFPIIRWSNENISCNRFENRGLLHTVLQIPHESQNSVPQLVTEISPTIVHCFCVHLGLLEVWRDKQIEALIKAIERETKESEPLILAGDFNDWRRNISNALKNRLGVEEVFLSKTGRHAVTYPASIPLLCLDRIYVKGFKIKQCLALKGNPWRKLSDHLALFAEVEL